MGGFITRLAHANDRPAIRVLFESVFGPWPGDAYWDWKYSEGNHGRARVWLVVSESDKKVVAHVGTRVGVGRTPWGPSTVAQVMDVMVHPQVRGQRFFESLLDKALRDLYALDGSIFVFGFAGIRPIRLGARLGYYRVIRAHYDLLPTIQTPVSQLLCEPLTMKHRLAFDLPSDRIGFAWTTSFWEWRFLSHPTHRYFWLSDGVGGSVVTLTKNQTCWSVLSCTKVPDTRVHQWNSLLLDDRGYGVLSPEPMMISAQVALPNHSSAHALTEYIFEPSQTDVF